jgi:hypothetical protein
MALTLLLHCTALNTLTLLRIFYIHFIQDNCPAHAKHSKHGIASCVVNEKGEACKNIKWAHNNTPLCFDECKGKVSSTVYCLYIHAYFAVSSILSLLHKAL